ncbi:MAG: hypothetical protein JW722_01615 [Demequinaceae bacterium]|nr:hypothetical protein [Demequinaceae bacterium]
MSSDVFIQAFSEGDPVHIRAEAVCVLADPYVIERSEGFASIQTPDGGADFLGYGDDGGLAVIGASGAEIWDLVVAIAQVTDAVIIPVGRPPLVVDRIKVADLPQEIQASVGVVTSGAELMAALGLEPSGHT